MTGGNERGKKSRFSRIFGAREKNSSSKINENSINPPAEIHGKQSLADYLRPVNMASGESSTRLTNIPNSQSFRIFIATWNVGGKHPHDGLNLNDILMENEGCDMYVIGFQEIVPLNAGNVLVVEDTDPAVKWLSLIYQTLNMPLESDSFVTSTAPSNHAGNSIQASDTITPIFPQLNSPRNSLFFQKLSLKAVSKTFIMEQGKFLKSCNCSSESVRKDSRDSCFCCTNAHYISEDDSDDDEDLSNDSMMMDIAAQFSSQSDQRKYSLVASKQMVGIFVTVWARKDLVQHIRHLRTSTIGRGVMGYLGNKGCISVSMTLHQTSFCFICSHLASGEKEGDELRRNSDVNEILKNTQFRKFYSKHCRRNIMKILQHDRIIWFGDLNYRIALSYFEANKLLQENDWDALLEKDQLKIEREAGRVFKGWNEGKIYFAPTYKYSSNSDSYAGESVKSKTKRRTPAWCDRILWHGDGIAELSYIRGESRFSDHRPVCAIFKVEVGVLNDGARKSFSTPNMRIGVEELLPSKSNFTAHDKR
ncbi:Type I inositol 1,4,5-trisphosphate 5-phosphatase CVP2 [Platanthera guangdongensis]|uniref:Type I inositol 1,4,5-trisphosphate 5-phosphatase CVP2 n=1 Tax=Platanthera guangdongensis TaxID=2320717 RepID=A0ABR2LT77_9ASPA